MDCFEHHHLLPALTHDILVLVDPDGHIVQVNKQGQNILGCMADDLLGQDWLTTWVHPKFRSQGLEIFKQALVASHTLDTKNQIYTAAGQLLTVHWRLQGLEDNQGQIQRVLYVGQVQSMDSQGWVQDLSRLEAMNKELTCLQAMSRLVCQQEYSLKHILEKILEIIPQAFTYPQHTGVCLTLDGQTFFNANFSMNASQSLVQDILVHQVKRGHLHLSLQGQQASGCARQFLSTEEILLAILAKHVGWIIAQGEALVTQRNLKQQLRHADRLAKIGQFAAAIAHELNEPLVNILGLAQLAADTDQVPESVHRDLDNIVKSALYSREVIKKLMIFGRQVPVQKTKVALNKVIEDTVHFIELNAAQSGIQVHLDLEDGLGNIWADPQHLKQVVVNLIVNAIQAMTNNGVLSIETRSFNDDVYLIITDTGVGMDSEVLKQIFNPFFTTKALDQGTGLGLSVVHGIIATHGGVINVHSTPGQGTRFEITFPCSV